MRRLVLTVLVLILGVGVLTPAYSAVKVGGSCQKAGSTTKVKGAKFTCIKVGKKLIWSDWAIAPKPAVSSPKPNNSNPIPIDSSPKRQHVPINNFEDLVKNYQDIQYWSWKKSSDAISMNKDFSIPIEVVIGPNSKRFANNDVKAIETTYRMFGQETSQTKIWLLYGWTKEPEWVVKEMGKVLAPMGVPNPISVRTSLKGEAVLWASYDLVSDDRNTTSGATDAHEYMHTIQHAQYLNAQRNGFENWGYMPRWMLEGGGQYVQDFVMHGQTAESWEANPLVSNQEWRKYDLDFFKSFLLYKLPANINADPWGWTSQWPNQRVYDVGALVYQALIAVKDPKSILLLMKDISKTHDLNMSFQRIYGISWTEAEPLVAEAIYKMTRN